MTMKVTMDQFWEAFLYHLRVERRSKATLSLYAVTRIKAAARLEAFG